MKQNKPVAILVFAIILVFAFYYFFIDTLSLSEITGDTGSAKANIFVNLFDFNTGLTRYDIYHIKRKSDYWTKRINQVQSISDIRRRQEANDQLVAEMMQDPSLKKITRKFLGFGAKSASKLMRIIASIVYQH